MVFIVLKFSTVSYPISTTGKTVKDDKIKNVTSFISKDLYKSLSGDIGILLRLTIINDLSTIFGP